jgi:hypothetical protein
MAHSTHPRLSAFRSGGFARGNAGFTLVATLLLLALLTILILALASIVRIETRVVGLSTQSFIAREHALLGIQQAIGVLQEELGPDQRVSAVARIAEPYADADDDGFPDTSLDHPLWLGTWDAWDTWLNAATPHRGSTVSIADTYTQGRASHFRRWLVSHPDPGELNDMGAAAQTDVEFVNLVGRGTLGEATDPSHFVRAPRINLETGAMAWWVSGENQKARISASESPGNAAQRWQRLTHWPGSGAARLDGLSDLPESPEVTAKATSLIGLAIAGNSADLESELADHFHDFTLRSCGLLTNVRNGGMKKDLNLLLENPTLPVEFGTEDFLDRSIDGTIVSIRPPTPDVPEAAGVGTYSGLTIPRKPNFTSWYSLHRYYSLYRGLDDPWGLQEGLDGSQEPEIDFHWGVGENDRVGQGYNITPIVLRLMTVISLTGPENVDHRDVNNLFDRPIYEYKLYLTPVLILWNPYNVTLTVPQIHIDNKPGNLQYKIYVDGQEVFEQPTTFPSGPRTEWRHVCLGSNPGEYTWPSGNPAAGHERVSSGTQRLRLAETGQGSTTPITFKPGEVRIFSISQDASITSEGWLNPGYDGPQQDGGFLAPVNDGDNDLGIVGVRSGGSQEFSTYDGLIIEEKPDGTLPVVEMAMRMAGTTNYDNYWVDRFHYNFATRDTYGGYSAITGRWVPDDYRIDLIPDRPGERMVFPNGNNRIPFASIEYVLKSGEDMMDSRPVLDGGDNPLRTDFRCRNFIHADPAAQRNAQGDATDRAKSMAQYAVYGRTGVGNQLNPDFDSATNRGFGGSAVSSSADYSGQTRFIHTELPVAPVTSLASLMHFKLVPGLAGPLDGSFHIDSQLYDIAPNQGLAIGNSFAHPYIPPEETYEIIPELIHGAIPCSHVYDHAFFNNDALWDGWFCSGMTPRETGVGHFNQARDLGDVVGDFIEGAERLPNPHLRLWSGQRSDDEIESLLVAGNEPASGSWDTVAAHLMLSGAFNVNSTSVDAWKAFLWGLRDTQLDYVDPDTGTIQQSTLSGERVVLSRFSLPASDGEGSDAGDPNAWLGLRLLTDEQVGKLAVECVRQVKLRGPFLNLADFINRRLEDSELGQVGALQAAIDWDEWNGNTPDPTADDSINGRFKNPIDLITGAEVTYPADSQIPENNPPLPNPAAATGSRWAGIPGYVTQADLLKRIGNQITVRDDTFRIRSYGEASGPDGKVAARIWCEAIVQRVPDYLDPTDDPETSPEDLTSALNLQFGRKFRIVSFRWLSPDEI